LNVAHANRVVVLTWLEEGATCGQTNSSRIAGQALRELFPIGSHF
jgi:hypothetical protein